MPPTSAATRIRAVRPADFDAWLPLWNGYNAFYGRAGETALAFKVTRTTWSRFLDDEDPIFALVAEREGAVVGLVHSLYHRSTTRLEREGRILERLGHRIAAEEVEFAALLGRGHVLRAGGHARCAGRLSFGSR